jgi:septal ring factor EnvC (AmiA/AmiB activator)
MARRAADRLAALQREADRLAAEERTLLGDLRRLEVERQLKNEELQAANAAVAEAEAQLATLDDQTGQLAKQAAAARPDVDARFVELYKLGQGGQLRRFLAIRDAGQIQWAARTIAVLSKLDHDRISNQKVRLDKLKASRGVLVEHTRQLTLLRDAASRAEAAAGQAVEARNGLIRSIDQQRDLNAQLVGELQGAQQRLQATLRDLSTGATPSGEPAVLPIRAFRADLEWPVAGPIRQPFGRGAGAWASGVEIAAAEGVSAHAVHEGTVAYADTFAGFGKLVIIDHGRQAFTLYGNLLDINVARGAVVSRGDTVGSVGASATGTPGLYFELRIDGRPADPLQWLKKR